MNGIVGTFDLAGNAPRAEIRRMLASAVSGIAAVNAYWDDQVGLAAFRHAQESSTQKRQPLARHREPLIIAADGRIDNRDDLLRALGVHPPTWEEVSDQDLILKAYEKWGVDCPSELIGNFAFAIWDTPRRRLFCARDHFGVRPFYYHRSDSLLSFASKIKALLSFPHVPCAHNERRIAGFLLQALPDSTTTFYRDICRLPPGHTLVASCDGVYIRPYWQPASTRELTLSSREEYAEAYRSHFTEAVASCIPDGARTGSLLSGGMDSSSVVCVARDRMQAEEKAPLDTFSLVFDKLKQCDERRYIDAVVEQVGIRPHYILGDDLNAFVELDHMLASTEEPMFTPNLFLHWQLMKSAREHGIRVLLDGFLGDNVISHGSRLITERAASGHWMSVLRDIRSISRRYPRKYRKALEVTQRFVLQPLVREPLRRAWYSRVGRRLPFDSHTHFARPDLLESSGWLNSEEALDLLSPLTPRQARADHVAELSGGALPTALEIASKAGRAFDIEMRFPFSDRRLVEFCLAIPPEEKYERGWTRTIARRGLSHTLPERVAKRFGKANLGPVFENSILVAGRSDLHAAVFEDMKAAESYVDLGGIQLAYRQLVEDSAKPGTLRAVWNSVVLSRWLNLERERRASQKWIPQPSLLSE